MIFADIEYQADYRSFHEELDACQDGMSSK
jgi:hypothetical protein